MNVGGGHWYRREKIVGAYHVENRKYLEWQNDRRTTREEEGERESNMLETEKKNWVEQILTNRKEMFDPVQLIAFKVKVLMTTKLSSFW